MITLVFGERTHMWTVTVTPPTYVYNSQGSSCLSDSAFDLELTKTFCIFLCKKIHLFYTTWKAETLQGMWSFWRHFAVEIADPVSYLNDVQLFCLQLCHKTQTQCFDANMRTQARLVANATAANSFITDLSFLFLNLHSLLENGHPWGHCYY
jgi:hypothetical protein